MRKISDPVFGALGYLLWRLSLLRCIVAHDGEMRPLSDGHHSQYCRRCAQTVWHD